jgi:flagellar capping protein FliD
MHLMTEKWTDGRLDEFEKRVDERFDRIDERFVELRAEMKQGSAEVGKRFDKIDSRLESMQKTLVFGGIAMTSAYMAGFAALVTQI